jgi:N-acetylneuraminate synthase
VIAEVAQAHDGSLGAAHAYIDAVAQTGASAVKFQTHYAAEESTPGEPWRVKFSKKDESRYEYWRRMEFSLEEWQGLADHARERGLVFLSSPFSQKAIDVLNEVGVPAWKVASGEVSNLPLLEAMAKTGKPVLLSSGLSTFEDLDRAVACVRPHAPVAIFQATSAYPCPPTTIGLNLLAEYEARYQCPVGLSDHSATLYAGLAAVALGASLLEVHVVFSPECFGPDTSSSLTPPALRQLVEGTRFIQTALAHPVDKRELPAPQRELLRLFGKSVVSARALRKGEILRAADLAAKKPGTGIPAARLPSLVGKIITRDVGQDELLREDDLG